MSRKNASEFWESKVQTDAFFELLKVSGHSRPELSRTLTEEEWGAIYQQAQKQALAGVLFDVVSALPREQQPPKALLMKWYGLALQIRRRNLQLNVTAAKVYARFRKHGFRAAILKGQGVALLYPNPLSRTCGDIDIWVEGTRKGILKYLYGTSKPLHVVYHNTPLTLSDNTEVEVHFTPSWMNNFCTNYRLQRFFKRTAEAQFTHEVELPEGAGRIAMPTAAFNRVYILVHIYRHLFGEGIGLRQLMDYYYVLRQGFTEQERKATENVLKDLGMWRFVRAVMYVMQKVFGLPQENMLAEPDEKEGKFFLNEVMMAGNFGHYDRRIVRKVNESMGSRFVRMTKRNLRFWRSYPSEVFCTPLFKVWHTCWRKYHGY